jgi:capsular polysaccharide biosynthesis protein
MPRIAVIIGGGNGESWELLRMTWQSAGRAIWRYRWLATILTAILVLVTGILVGQQPRTYETTSEVRIRQKVPAGEVPDLDTAAANAANYSLLVGGNEFAKLVQKEVAETLPGITEQEVNTTLSADPIPGTGVLQIVASGRNPDRITLLANAAIPALENLAVTQGSTEIVLPVDSATVPDSPVSPRVKLAIAIALILGLVMNGSLMVLLDLLRDRYADSDELQTATGRPVLATVPRFDDTSFDLFVPALEPSRDERGDGDGPVDERDESPDRDEPPYPDDPADDLTDERATRAPARRRRP